MGAYSRSEWSHQSENARLQSRIAELEAEVSQLRTLLDTGAQAGRREDATALIHHLMDDAPVGFALLDTDFRYQMVNAKLAQMHGVPAQAHIGRTVEEVAPHVAVQARGAFAQVLATDNSVLDLEFSGKLANDPGTTRYWSESWYPVFVADHRLIGVAAIVTEITDHKHALQALSLDQERFELVAAAATVGLWDWDLQTSTIHDSTNYGPLYGLPPGTAVPSLDAWLELVHPDDRQRLREQIRRTLSSLDEYTSEFRVVWPDNTVHWLLGRGRVLRDSHGRATRVLGVNMDVTARKQAEAEARESELRFQRMADNAPVMICSSGPDNQARFFNQGWLDFTGRTLEQEIGSGWVGKVHPEDRERALAEIDAAYASRRFCHAEYRLQRADGEYRWLVCNGAPRFNPDGQFDGYLASAIDITDLKHAHAEALARQKLESVGVVAGGIAHDFNNLLGSIVSEAELVEEDGTIGVNALESVGRIRLVASRAAGIVQELLAYAAQEPATFEVVDASELIREMLQLLKASIRKTAVLKVDLGADLPAVRANPSQMCQVVLNLVINASDALEEGGGTITIATSAARITDDSAKALDIALPAGDYVRLEVSDTGCGIADTVRGRIFDPFFTTKFSGRGLGLAVVHGIVRNHVGAVQVTSTPGHGARFAIWLPAVAQPEFRATAPVPSENRARVIEKTATILLVEDESSLREPVSKMLRKRGYTVIEAEDGHAAIEAFRDRGREIEAVVLDLTLPGISGAGVFRELHGLEPQLKVILTTAYSREKMESELGNLKAWAFVRKPYQVADLVKLLQGALQEKASTA